MHISWIIFLYIFPGKIEYCWSVSWYLKGFVALGWWVASYFCHSRWRDRWDSCSPWNFHGAIAAAKIRISWSNWGFTVPFLRVLQELGTAPLEIFHIPSTPPMIASFMAQIMFTGEFRVNIGAPSVHQDAFATIFMCREHTCQSTSGTNTRRALREEAFQTWKLQPHPRSLEFSSLGGVGIMNVIASNMNGIAPPHPTQTPSHDVALA